MSPLFLPTGGPRNKGLTKHRRISIDGRVKTIVQKVPEEQDDGFWVSSCCPRGLRGHSRLCCLRQLLREMLRYPWRIPPCITQYQVALLAPLYPLSMELVLLGLVLTILGTGLTYVGYSKANGTIKGATPREPKKSAVANVSGTPLASAVTYVIE